MAEQDSRNGKKHSKPDPELIKRLVRAAEIAKSESCRARNVDELETKMPCECVARFLGSGHDLISEVVVENGWRKFLRDSGDPVDPIERVMLFHLFLLHHRSISAYTYMGRDGLAGYKIIGALATKMTRQMITLSSTLKEWRQRRDDADIGGGLADEENARAQVDPLDPEKEQAEILAAHRKDVYWRRQPIDREELAATTQEQRAKQEEREREAEQEAEEPMASWKVGRNAIADLLSNRGRDSTNERT